MTHGENGFGAIGDGGIGKNSGRMIVVPCFKVGTTNKLGPLEQSKGAFSCWNLGRITVSVAPTVNS